MLGLSMLRGPCRVAHNPSLEKKKKKKAGKKVEMHVHQKRKKKRRKGELLVFYCDNFEMKAWSARIVVLSVYFILFYFWIFFKEIIVHF